MGFLSIKNCKIGGCNLNFIVYHKLIIDSIQNTKVII